MEGKIIMGNNYNWLSPVPKQSLSKMVVNKIKDAIIRGDLKPGDFLPAESELAESLGVGKIKC
jgi:DNA-binding FadR family transcriptional regulator